MKINEAKKETLPLSFVTSFMSEGWEKVGMLKEQKEAIHSSFSGTQPIEEIIQNLIDAYLICLGQIELYLNKDGTVEIPSEEELKLKENIVSSESFSASKKEIVETIGIPSNVNNISKAEIEEEKELENSQSKQQLSEDSEKPEAFEYFCDFDDPSGEPLTDKDIYNQ